jgi:hypothetical protein
MTLSDLIALVEAAGGPDRDLDRRIRQFFGAVTFDLHNYTASIDAVVALIRREMPGDRWMIEGGDDPCAAFMPLQCIDMQVAPTEALALLLAFLRAKHAKENADA